MKRLLTATGDVETKDIMYTLLMALPAAVDSLLYVPGVEQIFKTSDIPVNAARFLRENVTYREDGLTHQTIQLPNALFASGFGDCKSFSLFIAAVLTKAGIKNGFRFAAYQPGEFTHVYNFYIDNSNKVVYLDACIPNLQESNKAIKVENMEVSIIGRTPIAHKSSTKISGIGNIVTEIGMFPVRRALRTLIAINFRGFATAFQNAIDNGLGGIVDAWWVQYGGEPDKLRQSISAGRALQPLLGGGAAFDAAVAQDYAELLSTQERLTELLVNARLLGATEAELPSGPWNLSNPQQFNLLAQALNRFYSRIGITAANMINVALIRENVLPERPFIPVPGSGPGRTPVIGTDPVTATTGGVSVATVVGTALPLLILLPGLFRQIGVPEGQFLETLDNAAGYAGGLLPPNTPISPGPQDGPQNGLSNLFTLPNILIFGGLFYLLTRKKR